MLAELKIKGLRGFGAEQILKPAIPRDNLLGSGLTVIVGSNNSGKSTVIEALRAISQREPPSFTQGRRNLAAGDQVIIECIDENGSVRRIESVRAGSSECRLVETERKVVFGTIYVLSSRRVFQPYFGKSISTRREFVDNVGFPAVRANSIDVFAYRIFNIDKNREEFDRVFSKIIDPVPEWSIDQHDNGQYFLKIKRGDAFHSSEGMGEGLISLLYIIDLIFESLPGDVLVIDEPELSLHPALQRKLSRLLAEYARDRQIILSTHSPYFAPFEGLERGAAIARVHIQGNSSVISQGSPEDVRKLTGLLSNMNNPHILGLNAQEILFADDGIVLVEGQEDVIFLPVALSDVGLDLSGNVFGWGVGGADNMRVIARFLSALGFSKVSGILDANKADVAGTLSVEFPGYHFVVLPADDIRSKAEVKPRGKVLGLLSDDNRGIRSEFKDAFRSLVTSLNAYMDG